MLPKLVLPVVGLGLVLTVGVVAQEQIDHVINARIRKEGRENSQVMRNMHFLTDGHGPRLTGSPNYKAAADWAVKQLAEWGLKNARLEPWDFGLPGWSNERVSAFLVAPVTDSLTVEVVGT